jgi:hypothetical protein
MDLTWGGGRCKFRVAFIDLKAIPDQELSGAKIASFRFLQLYFQIFSESTSKAIITQEFSGAKMASFRKCYDLTMYQTGTSVQRTTLGRIIAKFFMD